MFLKFPAIKGKMGNREFFVAMMKLKEVVKLFPFQDWAELPPEQRAQRVIQKTRIPEITRYILENEEGYLFSSLTASFDCEVAFEPTKKENEDIGTLSVPFDAEMVINDGQHRRAAIQEAIKENPALGDDKISVVLFPKEDLDRMQQMFSDLNRTARLTSKSLNIEYDHRDPYGRVTKTVIERVPVFQGLVDRERVSLPLRSPKLFTLGAIYDATKQFIGGITEENETEKESLAIDFWMAVAENILEWRKVRDEVLRPFEVRQEYVNSHAILLWGLGVAGNTLLTHHPDDWKEVLVKLRDIDWRKSNKEWQGVAMSGTDIMNRRQSREDTSIFLKHKLGLPLTETEKRSLRSTRAVIEELSQFTS